MWSNDSRIRGKATMGYPEPVMFRRQYVHVRIIADATRCSSGIMKGRGVAPNTAAHRIVGGYPERESRRDAEKLCNSVDITYFTGNPPYSIPPYSSCSGDQGEGTRVCEGRGLRLLAETACSQTVSMTLIPGVQAELA
jgi:hypothetical protein